jgi:hypothetical protein
MSKMKFRPALPSAAVLGLALLSAALSGCDQGADPISSREPSASPAGGPPVDVPTTQMGEGHLLQGKELDDFLKTLPADRQVPASAMQPTSEMQPAAAAKSAANPACIIDFNSPKGLAHMADRAYTYYATSPYYIQPCFPYYAFVTPIGRNYYYLPTEASNTCPGSYGKLGYGSVLNCQNQQDAANFPRYASNGSPTDGGLGIVVTLPQDGINHNFRFSYFFARSGSIAVYAYRVGIGWWVWTPINVAPGFFVFNNAENVTEVRFHSSDGRSIFQVDNISITAL